MANRTEFISSNKTSIYVEARPEQKAPGYDLIITVETEKLILGLAFKTDGMALNIFQIATNNMSSLESDDFFQVHTLLSYIMPNLKEYCLEFINSQSNIILGGGK